MSSSSHILSAVALSYASLFCLGFYLGVNVMLRKIAVKAASKPLVEITQDGETLSIKTSTTVRTTHITFTVGQEFNESTVDGRPCTVRILSLLLFLLSHTAVMDTWGREQSRFHHWFLLYLDCKAIFTLSLVSEVL